jgi:hypothetical protein
MRSSYPSRIWLPFDGYSVKHGVGGKIKQASGVRHQASGKKTGGRLQAIRKIECTSLNVRQIWPQTVVRKFKALIKEGNNPWPDARCLEPEARFSEIEIHSLKPEFIQALNTSQTRPASFSTRQRRHAAGNWAGRPRKKRGRHSRRCEIRKSY